MCAAVRECGSDSLRAGECVCVCAPFLYPVNVFGWAYACIVFCIVSTTCVLVPIV